MTVICFDCIYTAVQPGSRMNVVVMLMQFYLHAEASNQCNPNLMLQERLQWRLPDLHIDLGIALW